MRSRPIPLTELQAFVDQSTVSGDWVKEFEQLGKPDSPVNPMVTAQQPWNIPKHRYPTDNLGAYDDTRVILSEIPGQSDSDYVNANWIQGYDSTRRYILTQAPIPSTLKDFFRMIWENNVHQIVMLASPRDIELGKCLPYYPESSAVFGEIKVTFQRITYEEDIVCRIYSIKQGTSVRVLVHYHFTAWPDLGVPEDPSRILNLIQRYRSSETFTTAWPLLVHCSAGVGRTGSFALTDIVYDMAEKEGSVDFLKHLGLLRTQRISMVEKPEQYFHSYKVILLAFVKGLFTKME